MNIQLSSRNFSSKKILTFVGFGFVVLSIILISLKLAKKENIGPHTISDQMLVGTISGQLLEYPTHINFALSFSPQDSHSFDVLVSLTNPVGWTQEEVKTIEDASISLAGELAEDRLKGKITAAHKAHFISKNPYTVDIFFSSKAPPEKLKPVANVPTLAEEETLVVEVYNTEFKGIEPVKWEKSEGLVWTARCSRLKNKIKNTYFYISVKSREFWQAISDLTRFGNIVSRNLPEESFDFEISLGLFSSPVSGFNPILRVPESSSEFLSKKLETLSEFLINEGFAKAKFWQQTLSNQKFLVGLDLSQENLPFPSALKDNELAFYLSTNINNLLKDFLAFLLFLRDNAGDTAKPFLTFPRYERILKEEIEQLENDIKDFHFKAKLDLSTKRVSECEMAVE